MPARIVILLALVLTINVPAMADAVDLGALLNETEGAVTRLDNGIEKARMLVALRGATQSTATDCEPSTG